MLAFGAARADLPLEAQTAVEQALAAIQKQDFKQADQCLQRACEKAPAADVYASLGQAEAKMPGRELRAICWLSAYLAAKPTAADRADVRSEIDLLQSKCRAKILAVIQSAEDSVRQMPSGEPRDRALQSLAAIWESWGDESRAQTVIDLIKDPHPKSDAFASLAIAYAEKAGKQFEAGDLAGSQDSLTSAINAAQQPHLMFPHSQDCFPQYRIAMAHLTMARHEIRTDDITGAHASMAAALDIADSIYDEWRSETKSAVATTEIGLGRVQLKAGDAAGSRESFAQAQKLADFVESRNEKYELLMDLADAQTKAGDLKDARACLVAAIPLVKVYNDPGHVLMEIVRAQLKAGDLAAALKTSDLLSENSDQKSLAQQALKTATLIQNADIKSKTFSELAGSPNSIASIDSEPLESARRSEMLELSSPNTADAWIEMLHKSFDAPQFTAYTDFSSYMAIADQIRKTPVRGGMRASYDPTDKLSSLFVVGSNMAIAQKQVDDMLRSHFKK